MNNVGSNKPKPKANRKKTIAKRYYRHPFSREGDMDNANTILLKDKLACVSSTEKVYIPSLSNAALSKINPVGLEKGVNVTDEYDALLFIH